MYNLMKTQGHKKIRLCTTQKRILTGRLHAGVLYWTRTTSWNSLRRSIFIFMRSLCIYEAVKTDCLQWKNKNAHSEWISTHCNSLKLVWIAGDLTYCCAYVLGPSIKYVVKKLAIFLSPSPYFVVFLLSKIGNCLPPLPPYRHNIVYGRSLCLLCFDIFSTGYT